MSASSTRTCPYCKEEIQADAVRCKHCRSTVTPEKPAHGGTCPFCKEAIHPEAIKCKHCGSMLGPGPLGSHGCGCGCGGSGQMPAGSGMPGARVFGTTLQPGATTGTGTTTNPGTGRPPGIAAAPACSPCHAAIVVNHFGHVIGNGVRQCCTAIPILLPNGSIGWQDVCWHEVCRSSYPGLVLV